MHWNVAQAKQHLSEMVRAAAEEPQLIYNRDRLVAAVVSADTWEQFSAWQRERQKRSVGAAFSSLREILREEDYTLELPERSDRPNAFADGLDDVSR